MSLKEARRGHGQLAAGRNLVPLQQGELDGLCGVYAIVNALRLIHAPLRPLSSKEVEALFRCGVNMLQAHGQLAFAAIWGVDQSAWKSLAAAMNWEANALTSAAVQLRWPLRKQRTLNRAQLFAVIEGAIERQQPVLVSVSGALEHYTVIRGYSPTRLYLSDSNRHQRLERRTCGLITNSRDWRHRLGARSVVVLEVST